MARVTRRMKRACKPGHKQDMQIDGQKQTKKKDMGEAMTDDIWAAWESDDSPVSYHRSRENAEKRAKDYTDAHFGDVKDARIEIVKRDNETEYIWVGHYAVSIVSRIKVGP